MIEALSKFRRCEEGAVTIDWVVLTAAIVALAGIVVLMILNSSSILSEASGTWVGAQRAGHF